MRDFAKNGRAVLAWSFPLLLISSGFAQTHATEHHLTLALAIPKLLAFGVGGMALTFLADSLDDQLDDTWPALSGFSFAVANVAVMTMTGSLTMCLCIMGGAMEMFMAFFLIALGMISTVLSGFVIAKAAGLHLGTVITGTVAQSVILSVLVVLPDRTVTYALVVLTAATTLYGLLHLRTKPAARP